MITIIPETKPEYDDMMDFAINYVCKHVSFEECAKFQPMCCNSCYKVNHIKCGIRVIDPLDNTKPIEI